MLYNNIKYIKRDNVKRYYSYEDFRDDTRKLIAKIKSFEPEAVVTIARGGYTLSHAITEGLNIRNLQSVRTELYDNDTKRENITMYGNCELDGKKKVLVVDDISDSGETLVHVMEYLKQNFPTIEFKVATLFYKKTSKCIPDFYVHEATTWIDFFWEKDFIYDEGELS